MSRSPVFFDDRRLRDIACVISLTMAILLPLSYWFDSDMWTSLLGSVTKARLTLATGIVLLVSVGSCLLFITAPIAKPPVARSPSEQERMLVRSGESYVLEIRNADLNAAQWGGAKIWRKIEALANPARSFLDFEDPSKAYPTTSDSVSGTGERMYGLVYETVAGRAVRFWPLPTFIAMPKHHPQKGRPAGWIWPGHNLASLGTTLFLWQDDEQTTSTQGMIERLFDFFDENPDVPAAFIVARDGGIFRDMLGKPRASGFPKEPLPRPTITHGNTAILVTRSDRVDRFVRPRALLDQGVVDPRNVRTDQDRFWHFYHETHTSRAPDAWHAFYKATLAPELRGTITPIMSTDFWRKHLPIFWKMREDKAYEPSPFLPVRWTGRQLQQFDSAPLVGYLHRPVKVALRDAEGNPLSDEMVMANLREGYSRAAALLDEGRRPTRLFYDGSVDRNWSLTVTEALKHLPDGGPDPTREGDSYDIGVRIGNLGAVSALGQIALATMAGHDDGRVSVTLNTGDGDHADFVVVSPPEEEVRVHNRRNTPYQWLLGGS